MLFRKIYVLNPKTKQKFEYKFEEGFNIIHGDNSSGKSTIVKSIQYALGFNPKWSKLWKEKDFVYNLTIKSDNGNDISIIRYGDYYKIDNTKFINYKEFREELYRVLNYDAIKIKKRNANKPSLPNIDMLFKFFYIDQELAWEGPLFYRNKYQQYSKEIDKIQYQHIVGLYNEKLHELTSEISITNDEINSNKNKVQKITDVIDSLGGENYTPLDTSSYEEQLHSMVNQIDEIRKKEISLNKKIIKLKLKNSEIKKNIELLKTINKDSNDTICKSCHQSIGNTSMQIDKNIVFDNTNNTILQLKNVYRENQSCINEIGESLKIVIKELEKVNELHTTKNKQQSELELNTVVQRLVAEKTLIQSFVSELTLKKKGLEKLKTPLKEDFNNKEKDIIDIINKQLVKLDLFFGQKSDTIVKLDPFLEIENTGIAYNLEKIAIYYSFLKVLDTKSIYNIPFIWDTLIKEEPGENIQEKIDIFYSTFLNDFSRQMIITYPRDLCNLQIESEYSVIEVTDLEELNSKDNAFITALID